MFHQINCIYILLFYVSLLQSCFIGISTPIMASFASNHRYQDLSIMVIIMIIITILLPWLLLPWLLLPLLLSRVNQCGAPKRVKRKASASFLYLLLQWRGGSIWWTRECLGNWVWLVNKIKNNGHFVNGKRLLSCHHSHDPKNPKQPELHYR